MNTLSADVVRNSLVLLTTMTFFVICMPDLTRAQDVTQARTSQDVMRRRAIELEIRDRIRAVTRPTEIIPNPDVAEKRQKVEWVNQLKQDFKRIQVINNSLRAAAVSTTADYKFITNLALEMKKRAQRLLTNLALPAIDEKSASQQRIQPDARMKVLSDLIDERVVSFISSPLFKEMSAVDIDMSIKASRDLKDIMSLCESMKRKAEALAKAEDKPQ
jgi:hypothetical protein